MRGVFLRGTTPPPWPWSYVSMYGLGEGSGFTLCFVRVRKRCLSWQDTRGAQQVFGLRNEVGVQLVLLGKLGLESCDGVEVCVGARIHMYRVMNNSYGGRRNIVLVVV